MANEKAIAILDSFRTNKFVEFKEENSFDEANNAKIVCGSHYKTKGGKEEWSSIGPFSYDDAFKIREFPKDILEGKILVPIFIPKELFEKKFTIGDYEISVSHVVEITDRDDGYGYGTNGCLGIYHDTITEWKVFVKFHGVYRLMGQFRNQYQYKGDKCKPTQTNWFHVKPTNEKPYIIEEAIQTYEYEYSEQIEKFFKSLDIKSLELTPIKIPYQDWYTHSQKKKSISDLSLKERDIEWFIKSETIDGIYRPERATIDRWLFDTKRDHYGEIFISDDYDKKLLQKLGIHTIQLRADSHFDVPKIFNLGGIKIKAPQKVIEKYKLEKYCKDNDVVVKITQDKKKKEEERLLTEHNNKFTLMQHGKLIKENVDREKIIEYLENFSPKPVDFEKSIVDSVKPIFDSFPKITKLYIAYWGRFFKYESAGEICDVNFECNEENNKLISKSDWDEIINLYEDNLQPDLDDKILENKYGWPDRGGIILGVQKNKKGKLEVFTEDYDFE